MNEYRVARAKEWLADPIFNELFAEYEASAVDRAVYAKFSDEETRVNALAEVRAIRALLSTLKTLAEGEANSDSDAAPA